VYWWYGHRRRFLSLRGRLDKRKIVAEKIATENLQAYWPVGVTRGKGRRIY
jgi:hypothetical protein